MPRARSASDNSATALAAPRNLKAPVAWVSSSFSSTSVLAFAEIIEGINGVMAMVLAMRRRAAITS